MNRLAVEQVPDPRIVSAQDIVVKVRLTTPCGSDLHLLGYETGAVFGYSHAMGGFKGSHAEYVRVPFGDYGAFTVPDGVDDRTAVRLRRGADRLDGRRAWRRRPR